MRNTVTVVDVGTKKNAADVHLKRRMKEAAQDFREYGTRIVSGGGDGGARFVPRR